MPYIRTLGGLVNLGMATSITRYRCLDDTFEMRVFFSDTDYDVVAVGLTEEDASWLLDTVEASFAPSALNVENLIAARHNRHGYLQKPKGGTA